MAAASKEDKIIKTVVDLNNSKILCTSPDRDLIVYPKWLCFNSSNRYKTPLFVKFLIENRQPFQVTYNIKAREKIFRIDLPCGFLEPRERRVIKLYLISADDWPLAATEYTERRLKLAVESLKVPADIQPANQKEATAIARVIWKRSFTEWPLERLYTKLNITLIADNSSLKQSDSNTKIAVV